MNVAIIVAAGRGSRMGGGRAKQVREISRLPTIIHTLRRFEEGGRIRRTHERSRLWQAQTPQCFRLDLLRRAYESALAEGAADATDCSALVERLGAAVRIVEGGPHNIKVTTPRDFALAEVIV